MWFDVKMLCRFSSLTSYPPLTACTLQPWILIPLPLYWPALTTCRGDFCIPSTEVLLVALVNLMNYVPAHFKHVWYYPIPGCILLGVNESLISSDSFRLFSHLPTLHLSLSSSLPLVSPLSLLLPSPIACHTPVPQGICPGSARLISEGEGKANWEPVVVVNLTMQGGRATCTSHTPSAAQ